MTELTMGQRIAECRKNLGISQEALGEKMGVSRQAISKWEADGAVPEIDKLIALSKLFEVSVGWLLGVEAEKEPHPQPQAEVSDELLYKVEEIVKRYQPKQETSEKRNLVMVLFAIAAIVVIACVSLFNPKPTDYSSQISGLESQIATLQSQISSLRGSITDAQSKVEDDSPISAHDFQLELDTEDNTALITLSAVPATWHNDYKATLSVRRSGSQILSQPMAWDGSALMAVMTLEIQDGYEYWLTLEYPDGTQAQTRLADNRAENMADSYLLACEVTQGTGKFDLKAGTLELVNYEIFLQPPYQAVGSNVWLSAADLILYHIRDGEWQVADTYELFKPADLANQNGHPEAISSITCYPNGPFTLPELEDGDGLVLWVKAEMSNGISTSRLINSWAYTNGEFIAGESVDE